MSLTKAEYLALLNSRIPDNSNQLISPEDVRLSFIDLIDSVASFLVDKEIVCDNFATLPTRTTRAGSFSIDTYDLPGRSNVDNTAFGYFTLGNNYDGHDVTAIGSYALACNIYGSHNVAVGSHSLVGNTFGSGNVAVGNYTLQSNKTGDFNIAIGHGAGYYIGPNSNFKFYLASHPVDSGSLCEIITNSGQNPLLYGDLLSLKLGVNTKTLHEDGNLQVNGSITPSKNKNGNLGSNSYMWGGAYIDGPVTYNSGLSVNSQSQTMLYFTSGNKVGIGTSAPSGNLGLVTVNGNILPAEDKAYSIGTHGLRWDGFFNDIVVSGNAVINDLQYNTINECFYDCKTLHLATSGICEGDIFNSSICGYLNDEALDGAGFEVHSSGSDYRRDYRFIYRFPDQSIVYVDNDSNYSRSRWQSNISLELDAGNQLISNRLLSRGKLSIVSESGGYGLFINPRTKNVNKQYPRLNIGPERDIPTYFAVATGDINFIDTTKTTVTGVTTASDYVISYISPSSGISVTQNFISRASGSNVGPIGFSLNLHDNENQLSSSQVLDRFSINSVGPSGHEALTILRPGFGSGLFGVSNIPWISTPKTNQYLPQTIFNVQARSNCAARFSSSGMSPASLQILSNGNSLSSGVELKFTPSSAYSRQSSIPYFDVVGIYPSTSSPLLSIAGNGQVSIGNFRVFDSGSPLTVYHETSNSGTISLREQSSNPIANSGFGRIFVKPVDNSPSQYHSLYFSDASGNVFDLIKNSNASNDLTYTDQRGNTFAGISAPLSRPVSSSGNTGFGFYVLNSVSTGSNNSVFGNGAGSSISSGSGNTIIGANSFTSANGNGNVIIGFNNARSNSSSNCIIIGNNLYTSGSIPENTLSIGINNSPVITGSLSGTRSVTIKNSKFSVNSIYDDQQLSLDHFKDGTRYVSAIQVKDNLNSSINDGYLSIRFLDQNDSPRTLVNFDHKSLPMSNSASYQSPSEDRPFVEVNGDIKLRGAIRFANGTSMDDANLSVELNFIDLEDALDTQDEITTANSYIAISVPSGDDHFVGRMTLQALSEYVGSGFASVSNNCNHIFTNAEASVSKTNNGSSIFIGCDAGAGATGWKHGVMIGSEAGNGATTPNVGLATDTAPVFIGYRSGKDADNIENSIFIGTNAGESASSASDSLFIGSNAGYRSNYANSIGIGENALRGLSSIESGTGNIEIVTGLLDNQRLMYSGNYSNKINIQNLIAGDTQQKRLSIGSATLSPDAPLSVRKNDLIAGHASSSYIQTWHCNNNMVAAIDCNGNFITNGSGVGISGVVLNEIEGVSLQSISAPVSSALPTSGLMSIRDSDWNIISSGYVVNKDPTLSIPSGAFVIAKMINGTYRPIWVGCE